MADAITRIAVSGFKSIKDEQSIEIRPLTILAGANSSGKSSIMQPLLLMKQTLEKDFDPGPLWLGGPNVKFNSAEELLSKGEDSFCVRIDAGPENWHRSCFKRKPGGFDIAEVEFRKEGFGPVRFWPGMPDHNLRQNLINNPWTGTPEGWNWNIETGRCSLEIVNSAPHHFGRAGTIAYLNALIHRVMHVPGLRGSRERTYLATAVGPTFPSTFDLYTASVINSWQLAGNDDARDRLEDALVRLQLTSKVQADQLDANQITLLVDRMPVTDRSAKVDLVNVADVGFGVSQILPVIVALTVATKKNLVYIEEPEAHLHPNAQSELASILAETARRGVRIVVETHSSILLRSVQTCVARGQLKPDLVKLHWFTRDAQGFTQIHSEDLDANGAFGDWPEDFDEIELGAENDYLNAVEARHARR